jgi:hypothetical protein
VQASLLSWFWKVVLGFGMTLSDRSVFDHFDDYLPEMMKPLLRILEGNWRSCLPMLLNAADLKGDDQLQERKVL